MRNSDLKCALGNGAVLANARIKLTPTIDLAQRQKLSGDWYDVDELSTREPWNAVGMRPQIMAVNKIHGVGPVSEVGCLLRGLIWDVATLAGARPGTIAPVDERQRIEATNRILAFRERVRVEIDSGRCRPSALAIKLPHPKKWRFGFLGRPPEEDAAMMEAALCAHGAVGWILSQCKEGFALGECSRPVRKARANLAPC